MLRRRVGSRCQGFYPNARSFTGVLLRCVLTSSRVGKKEETKKLRETNDLGVFSLTRPRTAAILTARSEEQARGGGGGRATSAGVKWLLATGCSRAECN